MPTQPARPYILNELTWKTVRDTRYEVAVLPWGATEAHNFHLPYSTDNVETEQIAALAARHATERGARVVVLPAVPFGVNTGQLDIPLCVNLNPSTQALVLRDVATALAAQGVPKLVILNGHGGNDFRQMIRDLQPAVSLFLCTVNWYQVVDPKPFFRDLGDHAGELETSVMLHLAPELVRPLAGGRPRTGAAIQDRGAARRVGLGAKAVAPGDRDPIRSWIGTLDCWARDFRSGRTSDAPRVPAVVTTRFWEDHMHRILSFLVLVFVWAASAHRVLGQAKWTDAQKIANDMTAAPSFISEKATIVEMQHGIAVTLRAGTNGWTCMPTNPANEGNEPMCVDEEWMSFIHALDTKATPHVTRVGVGYMIAPAGAPGSNTDPFAREATPTNEWGYDPPHVMLLVSDPHELDGIPTKRQSGGPWVMWAGTPDAHIKVPLAPPAK